MLWPETVIFWGAGATASLGFPSTADIGKIVHELSDSKDHQNTHFDLIKRELGIFLTALNSKNFAEITETQIQKVSELYCRKIDGLKKILEWREHYDWYALQNIALSIPVQNGDYATYLNDLYNVIDENIQSGTGFWVSHDNTCVVLNEARLKKARTLLDVLQLWTISCAYHSAIKSKKATIAEYFSFAEKLAELMREEGKFLKCHNKLDFSNRAFYLFSYAVISMNYDPFLLWVLLNIHKKLNEQKVIRFQPCSRVLKLFHDFSLYFGIRQIKKENEKLNDIWYPMNEAAAQRINSYENLDRVVRIGKFYFPHGSLGFRKCPHCGKLNIKLGDKWENFSQSLFFNFPFPTDLNQNEYRYNEENEEVSERGRTDAVKCQFCDNMTYTYDLAYVTQSSFKQRPTSFLAEMQSDMKVCLENCKHVVLMGYSLPQDDVLWRSVMMSKQSKTPKFCSVVVGYEGKKGWIAGESLQDWIDNIKRNEPEENWNNYGIQAIESAISVFGKKNVRAFTGGIPDVWKFVNVKDLLYPETIFTEGFPYFLKKRIKTDKKI